MDRGIILKQFTKLPNAGDVASRYVVSRLLGRRVSIAGEAALTRPNLIGAGSILHWSDRKSIVWGTGLISESTKLRSAPARIVAVRGHLTRQRLAEQGIHCPGLVGDPGSLISDLFAVDRPPQGVGIVPHYVDRDAPFVAECLERGAVLIDPFSPLETYLTAIASCEVIVSSSLHGIVFAHAYGRPAVWVTLSSGVIGGRFKFLDYWSSVGFSPGEVPNLSGNDPFQRILDEARLPRAEIDKEALRAALLSISEELVACRGRHTEHGELG